MRSFKVSVVKILTIVVAMLMLGTDISAQVNVTLPTVTGTSGMVKNGAITVGDLTGQNVTAFQFTVTYDPNIVYITGVDVTGGKVSANDLVVNADQTNGRISVAWAKTTPLSGSGTLLNLVFQFRNVGTSALNVGAPLNFMFNAGTPAANVTAGTATTAGIMVYGGTVSGATSATELMIPIWVTPLTSGNNVVSYNFTATYNPAVFHLTGYEIAGTLSAGGSAQINYNNTTGTVNFAWARTDAMTTTTDAVLVYLKAVPRAAGTSAVNITNFMFNAGTPVAATQAGSVTISTSAPTLTLSPTGPHTINENQNLAITLTGFDPDGTAMTYSFTSSPAVTNATLVGTAFNWTPDYLQAGSYSFTFTVTDGNAQTGTAVATVTVADVNRAPSLTLNPASPYTIPEGSAFSIQLVKTDPDTDNTWTFTSTTRPTGANLNATSGLFTWTPSYTQAGTYSITFTVTDNKGGVGNAVANITVTNVNRAPVFTTVLPPGRVVPVHNVLVAWNFFYTANDPDGDPVTFSLEAGPDGSSITSAGIFTWMPRTNQAGKSYVVTVKITDGTLSTFHSETITASSTITGVEDEFSGIPTEHKLLQNYPNPFNPSTTIVFGLPKESNVRLTVFNLLGQEVAMLLDKTMAAGFHKVDFDASNLNTGLYVYKIQADNYTSVKKMLFVK
jgi:hypothetical protein